MVCLPLLDKTVSKIVDLFVGHADGPKIGLDATEVLTDSLQHLEHGFRAG